MERCILAVMISAVFLAGIQPASSHAETRLISPSQIQITGANHFSCDDIAAKLSLSLMHQRTLSPESPVDDLPAFFEQQILQNYHRAGFLDVSAQTHVDYATDQYHIDISEGCQHVAGEVRVTGLPESDVTPFLEALVSPGVPPTTTIDRFEWTEGRWRPVRVNESGKVVQPQPSNWTIGEPVRALDQQRQPVEMEIERAFAAIGHASGQVQIDEKVRLKNSISLTVNVTELGPPILGRHIQFSGCKRNSEEAVLSYLKIDPDEVLTSKRFEEMWQQLWLSGRFVKSRFHVAPPKQSGDLPSVTCELQENEYAPSLLDPLSEPEQIMLRFHQWLSQLHESDETLLLELPSTPHAAKCWFAPSQGFLVRAGEHDLLAHSNRVAYCHRSRKSKLVVPLGRMSAVIDVALDFTTKSPGGDRKTEFRFNANLNAQPEGSLPRPILLRVRSSPSVCLELLHSPDTHNRIEKGILILESPQRCLRIDAETGRLLGYVHLNENGEKGSTVSPAKDDFKSLCFEMESEWKTHPDYFVPAAPVSSIVRFITADPNISRFLLEALTKKYERALDDRQIAVVLKLVEGAFLPIADEICIAWQQQPPGKLPPFYAYGQRELYSDASQETALWTIFAAISLFPQETWPQHLVGAVGFAMARKRGLYRFHIEPLLHTQVRSSVRDMLVAELFRRTNAATANSIAWRGLSSLTQETFYEDRAVLLDEGSYFGRFLVHAAETLQDLTEQEVDDLMDTCFGGPEPGFATMAYCLRTQRDRPAWEVLPDAVEAGWNAAWHDIVKARLSEVVKTTKPAVPQWNTEKDEKQDTLVPNTPDSRIQTEEPFAQRAKSPPNLLGDPPTSSGANPVVPQTGPRFELQGPFSK